jgi:hypothetical protein
VESVRDDSSGLPPGPPEARPSQPELDVDAELLALPAPPRAQRALTLGLLVACVLAALTLVVELRSEVAYFFERAPAVSLGELPLADAASAPRNAHVRLRGTPMLSTMIRFERFLTGEPFVLFPLAGQRHVLVQLPAALLDEHSVVAAGELHGRLLRLGDLGARYRPLRELLSEQLGVPVTSETLVLLAGESPSDYAWALWLCALCVGALGVTLVLIVRWFRPLRA